MKKEKQFSKRDNISSRPQKEAIDISISFHEDENQLKNKLLKSHKKLNEDIASNIKAKDNSLSDLIFQDSSFYSPLGAKKLNDDHGLKHVKKEDLLNVRSLPVSFKKEVIDECLDENEKCSNFSNEKIKNDDS